MILKKNRNYEKINNSNSNNSGLYRIDIVCVFNQIIMEAKELRIGNLIEFLGNVKEIYSISNHPARKEIYWLSFSDMCDAKIIHAKPIPLTEEWLLKFGFFGRQKDDFLFTKNMDLIIVGCENDYNGIYIGKINYVHQFQNLYFALTGEELTIKN